MEIGGELKNIVRGGITRSMNEATFNAWFKQVVLPGAEITEPGGMDGTDAEQEAV